MGRLTKDLKATVAFARERVEAIDEQQRTLALQLRLLEMQTEKLLKDK